MICLLFIFFFNPLFYPQFFYYKYSTYIRNRENGKKKFARKIQLSKTEMENKIHSAKAIKRLTANIKK